MCSIFSEEPKYEKTVHSGVNRRHRQSTGEEIIKQTVCQKQASWSYQSKIFEQSKAVVASLCKQITVKNDNSSQGADKHNFFMFRVTVIVAVKPNDGCKTCDYAENITKSVGWPWSVSFYIALFSVVTPDSRDTSWECIAGRTHAYVLNTRMIALKVTCCNWQGSRDFRTRKGGGWCDRMQFPRHDCKFYAATNWRQWSLSVT